MVLLVSYDLNGAERPAGYSRLHEYLARNALAWTRPLYSQWLIETNAGPVAWREALQQYGLIDSNDRLLICPIVRPHDGWLPRECWDWLNART